MDAVDGARQFQASGRDYDGFMGRYSRVLAVAFADSAQVAAGQVALDVGCGPGALTGELVRRLGAASVRAVDPSEPFVADCHDRHPGVDVRVGRAEALPFDDATVDRVLSQLVLHFVSDPDRVAAELARVLRPGGVAAACVWDFAEGMQMLRLFWDAALAVRPDAPDEATHLAFGGPGEIAGLLESAGFDHVRETTLVVTSTYADFAELWAGFEAGIGPAGGFLVGLERARQAAVRTELFTRLGRPSGAFTLQAVARSARGTKPA